MADSIVIKIKADKADFEKGLKDAEMSTKKLGDTLNNSGKSASLFGDVLKANLVSDAIKTGINFVVDGVKNIGGAIMDLVLKPGLDRAMDIENARFKLQGLGHDTQTVDLIMQNALSSVKGTSYGLNTAATVAASAVAAGVKPGQELERTLKLVADASAIAGSDMGEMGAIFNKVASAGKISAQEINQLNERGIPITQLLADVTGVATEEINELVSAGKIGFPEFQAAIEKGMGGAAQTMGQTFQGSLANLKTALARMGADILTPFMNNLTPILGGVTSGIDNIAGRIKTGMMPVVDMLSIQMRKFVENINWDKFADNIQIAIKKSVNAIKTIIDVIKWIIDNRGIFVAAITAMIAAFVAAKIITFATAFKGVVDVFKTANGIIPGVKAAMESLNITVAANPCVALAAAIAAVVAVMGYLLYTSNEWVIGMQEEAKAAKMQKEIALDNKEAWDSFNATRQESLNKGMSEISHYQELYGELTNIVDANGRVKEGYEARAQFITSTLSQALGTEITITDGVIQNYNTLQNSIQGVIEKKKAQIILETQETGYKRAIEEKNDLLRQQAKVEADYYENKRQRDELQSKYDSARDMDERDLYIGKLSRLNQIVKDQEVAYNTNAENLREHNFTIAQYEGNHAEFLAGNYDKISIDTWSYVESLGEAGNKEIQQLQDKIAAEQVNLTTWEQLNQAAGDNRYTAQITASQRSLDEMKSFLNAQTGAIQGGTNENNIAWLNGIAQQLSTVTGSQVQFRDAGNGQVQMYTNGVASGKPMAIAEMSALATETIEQIIKEKGSAQSAGEGLIDGVNAGINNQSKQSSVFSAISNFAGNILSRLQSKLEENSPSKATMRMGEYLGEGLGIGIENSTDFAVEKAEDQAKEVLDAYGDMTPEQEFMLKFSDIPENFFAYGKSAAQEFIDGFKETFSKLLLDHNLTLSLNNKGLTGSETTNNSTTNAPVMNFYQPVQSPDVVSREVRKLFAFGLAGAR